VVAKVHSLACDSTCSGYLWGGVYEPWCQLKEVTLLHFHPSGVIKSKQECLCGSFLLPCLSAVCSGFQVEPLTLEAVAEL